MISWATDACVPCWRETKDRIFLSRARLCVRLLKKPEKILTWLLTPCLKAETQSSRSCSKWMRVAYSKALSGGRNNCTMREEISTAQTDAWTYMYLNRYPHPPCTVREDCVSALKGVCLLHLLSENIFPVLRSNWFYVLMKQKLIWNLSLCYFSLFCFYLSGYDARTAERKSDSTWRTWYKQTARVYHSRRPISWLIPEMQYPVIYVIKFSNN